MSGFHGVAVGVRDALRPTRDASCDHESYEDFGFTGPLCVGTKDCFDQLYFKPEWRRSDYRSFRILQERSLSQGSEVGSGDRGYGGSARGYQFKIGACILGSEWLYWL